MNELKTQFDDLLRAYRQFQSPEPGTTAEERKDLEQRAKLAECTFRACFKSKLSKGGSNVLSTMDFDSAINEMISWASQLIPKDVQNATGSREIFQDAPSCSERLQGLTSEIEGSSETFPWPLIRKIRWVIFVQSHVCTNSFVVYT